MTGKLAFNGLRERKEIRYFFSFKFIPETAIENLSKSLFLCFMFLCFKVQYLNMGMSINYFIAVVVVVVVIVIIELTHILENTGKYC